MKRSHSYGVAIALAAGFVALPMLLNAQDAGQDAAASGEETADAGMPAEEIKLTDMTLADLMAVLATPEDALPDEMQDPAFRKYVDVSLLSVAWADLNAVLMTDIALQLQEGERILRRPHRAISAQELLQTAAKIAGENNDELTLARIKAAAESSGDKELAGQVAVAAKLGGSARDMAPEMTIPIDAIDATEYADLQGFMLAVRAARLAGDVEVLQSLAEQAEELTGLSDAQRATITKNIDDSVAMVNQAGKTDPTVDALEKIRGATRGYVGYFGHGGRRGGFHGHFGGRRGGHHGGHFGGGHGHFGGHWGHHGGGGHWGGHWGGHHGGHGGGHWGGHHGGHWGGHHH